MAIQWTRRTSFFVQDWIARIKERFGSDIEVNIAEKESKQWVIDDKKSVLDIKILHENVVSAELAVKNARANLVRKERELELQASRFWNEVLNNIPLEAELYKLSIIDLAADINDLDKIHVSGK